MDAEIAKLPPLARHTTRDFSNLPGGITETEDLLLAPPAKFEGGGKGLKIVFRGSQRP